MCLCVSVRAYLCVSACVCGSLQSIWHLNLAHSWVVPEMIPPNPLVSMSKNDPDKQGARFDKPPHGNQATSPLRASPTPRGPLPPSLPGPGETRRVGLGAATQGFPEPCGKSLSRLLISQGGFGRLTRPTRLEPKKMKTGSPRGSDLSVEFRSVGPGAPR